MLHGGATARTRRARPWLPGAGPFVFPAPESGLGFRARPRTPASDPAPCPSPWGACHPTGTGGRWETEVRGAEPPGTGRAGVEGPDARPRERERPAPKDRPAHRRRHPAAITPYRNARFTTQKLHAATIAAAGMVMNQPRTMFLATPHRTAFTRFVAPTPMIAEVMTWVVEIGALKM